MDKSKMPRFWPTLYMQFDGYNFNYFSKSLMSIFHKKTLRLELVPHCLRHQYKFDKIGLKTSLFADNWKQFQQSVGHSR